MHEQYMRHALELAQIAYSKLEVPVGAVVVRNGVIVGQGHNMRETRKNAIAHAEMIAIDEACRNLNGWRLWECDLYVTLEPCMMCAGAIINARLKRVFFGAHDKNLGMLTKISGMNSVYKPEITGGILEDQCAELLKLFFENLRLH